MGVLLFYAWDPSSADRPGTERAAWAGISDTEAKRIARDAVQHLADSEPDDNTIEAQERLRGTPQESLFCVSADVLEQAIYTVIANATYDAPHYSPAADLITVSEGELWQLEQAVLDAEDLPRPQVQIESLRGLLEKLRRISEGTSND